MTGDEILFSSNGGSVQTRLLSFLGIFQGYALQRQVMLMLIPSRLLQPHHPRNRLPSRPNPQHSSQKCGQNQEIIPWPLGSSRSF